MTPSSLTWQLPETPSNSMYTAVQQRLPTEYGDDGTVFSSSHMVHPLPPSPFLESESKIPFLTNSSSSPFALSNLPYEKDNRTRITCYVGLALTTVVAIGLVVLGCLAKDGVSITTSSISTSEGLRQFTLNTTLKEFVPLAINIVITLCTESLGLIHATSLKWALYYEDRLEFNANLRLFAFARRSWANSRLTSIIYILALALCYASSSAILVTLPNEACNMSTKKYTGPTLFTLSKSGPLCLGTSLLILCSICLWSTMTTKTLTWSTHPLTVLAAAVSDGRLIRRKGRCMRAVHDKALKKTPSQPQNVQKSAYVAHKAVFKVLCAVGIILLLLFVWFGAVQGYNASGCNWSLLPTPNVCGYQNIPNMYDQTPCTTSILTIDIFPTTRQALIGGNGNEPYPVTQDLGIMYQILFTVLIQSVVTAGLHCAELEVTLSRDETMWRAMATRKGADASKNSTLLFLRSRQSLALLVFKPLIHWIYGLSMTITYNGLYMRSPQIMYLAIAWGLLLVFILCVSLRKPEGPLPATYGHLQTMADVVDDWSDRIYWGHKSEDRGICHAGTSSEPLPNVRMDALYMGTGPTRQRRQLPSQAHTQRDKR